MAITISENSFHHLKNTLDALVQYLEEKASDDPATEKLLTEVEEALNRLQDVEIERTREEAVIDGAIEVGGAWIA